MSVPTFSHKRVLIIGAGAFGSSAAHALAAHASPPSSIVVIDRSSSPGPAPDAASSDINKIVRSDYWASPARRARYPVRHH
jgi:glycine/D-amino acid oxidase-like deaminating enzyme